MVFKCPVCGKVSKQKPDSDFTIELYENALDWPKNGEQIPLDKYYDRLGTVPQVGEKRLVNVMYPFRQEIGEEFWNLFMPGMSYFNGWDTTPEELFQSAVVKCRMEQVIEESWIKVTILEAIPLQEVSKRFPAVDNGENSAWRVTECENLFEYKCWKYYSWNCEGDVGGWSLVYVDEACVNHLILSNEWMMCDEHTYCGNIILEQEVLDRFKKK
jgi:hypothetical protein